MFRSGGKGEKRTPLLRRSHHEGKLTDLKMTKLCAEAMGIALTTDHHDECWFHWPAHSPMISPYDPLHDDAQEMALVKRFWIAVYRYQSDGWCAEHRGTYADNRDLNRAIVECVAKMQYAKVSA